MSKVCLHFTVSGRVQRVYFRASTEEKATELGLTGWVRNREDGRVEGVACGDQNTLDEFTAWLHQGPPLAKVDNVDTKSIAVETFTEFEARYE